MRMSRAIGLSAAILAAFFSVCAVGASDELIRGLVVDRGDDVVWIGLPCPVEKGTVFNVMLVPGDRVIGRAKVVFATPDAPYVAKAKLKLLDRDAFVPIGAYVESTADAIADRDKPPGYEAPRLEMKGPNPLSFNASLFFPTAHDLKRETDYAWPAFQLSYRLCGRRSYSTSERIGTNLARCKRVEASLGLAYYHGEGSFTVGGISGNRDFRVLPLTLDVKIWLSGGDKSKSECPKARAACGCAGWFARLGVGAYKIDDERTFGGVTDIVDMTTFGWQGALGYESRTGRFAQAQYVDVSRTDFRGVLFSLGARF